MASAVAGLGTRSSPATSAPASARATAMPWPSPWPAPVTRATFPSNLNESRIMIEPFSVAQLFQHRHGLADPAELRVLHAALDALVACQEPQVVRGVTRRRDYRVIAARHHADAVVADGEVLFLALFVVI